MHIAFFSFEEMNRHTIHTNLFIIQQRCIQFKSESKNIYRPNVTKYLYFKETIFFTLSIYQRQILRGKSIMAAENSALP